MYIYIYIYRGPQTTYRWIGPNGGSFRAVAARS